MDGDRRLFDLDKDTESVMLSYLVEYYPLLRFVSKAWARACRCGDGDGVNFSKVLTANGHLEALVWALGKGCPGFPSTWLVAADHGRLDILKWVKANEPMWADWQTVTSENHRYREVLIFICDIKGKGKTLWNAVADHAARGGHINVLDWCFDDDVVPDRDTLKNAAKGGNMGVLDWVKNRIPQQEWNHFTIKNYDICNIAAGSGNLAMLMWARENGFPWSSDVCYRAAKNGSIKCVAWIALKRQCSLTTHVWEGAITHGHADLMDWLEANDCPRSNTRHHRPP